MADDQTTTDVGDPSDPEETPTPPMTGPMPVEPMAGTGPRLPDPGDVRPPVDPAHPDGIYRKTRTRDK